MRFFPQSGSALSREKTFILSTICPNAPSQSLTILSPSPQVVSLLRLKHNMKAEVCQLTSCDYIVSNRMAVKRKTASGKSCSSKIYPGLSLNVLSCKMKRAGERLE